jgi:hypothetical protein
MSQHHQQPQPQQKDRAVELPKLSPEQDQLMREKYRAELAAESAAAEQGEEKHVYTNITSRRIVLGDLGTRSGNSFSPETFDPGETKDLRELYRLSEIKRSRHLKLNLKASLEFPEGKLVKGERQVQKKVDPLGAMATNFEELEARGIQGSNSFGDPLSGQRYYDRELKKVQAKEEQQIGKKLLPGQV